MVKPGELVVIQRGMKFKVGLPDGPSRGCECFWYGNNVYLFDRELLQTCKKYLALTINSPSLGLWAVTVWPMRATLKFLSQASTSIKHHGKVRSFLPIPTLLLMFSSCIQVS